jgi:retrotransposon gag protein
VYKRMTDLKPEFYDGLGDPTKFEDWVSSMEKLFDMAACPDNWKVKFATYYLKGEADLWWKTVKNVRDQPNFDWESLQVLMRKIFYPDSFRRQKEGEFLDLRQGDNMTVREYVTKFNELARFAPRQVESDAMRKERLEEGLIFKIQEQVIGRTSTFDECYDLATQIERVQKRREEVLGNKRQFDLRGQQQQQNKTTFKRTNFGGTQYNQGGGEMKRKAYHEFWCKKCGKQGPTIQYCNLEKGV